MLFMPDYLMQQLMYRNTIFHYYQFKFLKPGIHGTIFSTTDLSTAYQQVALTLEAQKLLQLFVENEQIKYKRGFPGLKALLGFFTREMTILFVPLTENNEIVTCIDDIIIQADTKTQMFNRLHKFFGNFSKI